MRLYRASLTVYFILTIGLYDEYTPDFDGVMDESCFLEEYDEGTLEQIYNRQMRMVKLLKKHNQTKHLANR